MARSLLVHESTAGIPGALPEDDEPAQSLCVDKRCWESVLRTY